MFPGKGWGRGLVLAALMLAGACRLEAQAAPAAAVADLNANFVGSWTGQLEYRDYQTNERVFLPTWLKIAETPDRRALVLSYVYDDGPAKTVRESVTMTLDAGKQTVTFAAKDDKASSGVSNTTYAATGFEAFAKGGRGTLELTGSGAENGKPVDIRITITLRRNLYTYRKETRHTGPGVSEEFQFRDAYLFTRAEPPVGAAP